MSFIYENNKLINSLVEAGQKDLEKFGQQKRQLDTTNLYDNKASVPAYEIAQKLLFGLQRDLGDATAPASGAPIGIEGADPNQPSTQPTALPKDLRTLGDFLQWSANNKITWKGKRFAWTPEEVEAKRDQPDDPTQKAWEFTSMHSDRNNRRVDRQPQTVSAYADKEGLIGYLAYLRDGEDAKTNRVLAFMLATLIGEANAYLRVAGEKTIDTRNKPGAKVDIDPNTIVDVVPNPMSLEQWNAGVDGHPFQVNRDTANQLRVKDLLSQGAFQAWFRNRNVKIKVPVPGQQTPQGQQPQTQEKIVAATASDGDPCLALHILYKRANHLRTVAVGDDDTVPNYSKAVALYLQQVTTFGKNYVGADGKPCAVTSQGTVAPTTPNQKPGQPGAVKDPEAIKTIAKSMLPFKRESVDFIRIENFFEAYGKVLSTEESPRMQAMMNSMKQARDYMAKASACTVRGDQRFAVSNSLSNYQSIAKPPAGTYLAALLDHIKTVLESVAYVVQDFQASYGSNLDVNERSLVAAQVGTGPGTGSIYAENFAVFDQLHQQLQRVKR